MQAGGFSRVFSCFRITICVYLPYQYSAPFPFLSQSSVSRNFNNVAA